MRTVLAHRRIDLLRWLPTLPMGIIGLSTVLPLVLVVIISLKTKRDFLLNRFTMPQQTTFANYGEAWHRAHLAEYFVTSVIVTAGAVCLLLLVASLAGYGLSILRFRGRRVMFYLILASMMIPVQVILVPFYQLMIALDLINTRIGLILSYTAFFTPFSVYLMTAYYGTMPRELAEAAKMDGANLWQTWRHVMLPLGKPALLTLGILNTLYCWNDVLIALLVLQDQRTIMVGISSLRGEYSTNIPMLAAGVVMAAFPVLALFVIFQKRIVSGVIVGAVKG
ncbi:MAG TPA: carbohydrate ABC transporter permease [Pararobbsia sp.]|nr:carbohydrate ABC transporter permease [Pararobbsia sp.]